MLIPKHHGFKRQYVIGGAGIFDSIANFVGRLFASSTAKQGVQRLMEGALDLSNRLRRRERSVWRQVRERNLLGRH